MMATVTQDSAVEVSISPGAVRLRVSPSTTGRYVMKYMLQIIGFRDAELADGEGPTAEEFVAWQRALVDAGVHVDGGFLDDYQLATSMQVETSGERIVTNGPFPETREYLGGWTFIDVPDLDAALEWAARCPGARYGRVEVRPVMG
jgi:hypothetical protein